MKSPPNDFEPDRELDLFVEDLGAEELPDTASLSATFFSFGSASCPFYSVGTASCLSSS